MRRRLTKYYESEYCYLCNVSELLEVLWALTYICNKSYQDQINIINFKNYV